jgi:hypothetical protein
MGQGQRACNLVLEPGGTHAGAARRPDEFLRARVRLEGSLTHEVYFGRGD